MIWFVLAISLLNIFNGLVTNTKDMQSAIYFKVIPFFLGIGTLIYFLITRGII